MKASLPNLRISPRKVRLVANLVKGKTVPVALAELRFLTKRSANPIAKLISSAVAASAGGKASGDKLKVKDVRVDKGQVMKRSMPRAFGRSSALHKRSSHISVILETI